MSLGSVPLRPWQRGTPPTSAITSVPPQTPSACSICPVPICQVGDEQPLAVGMGSGDTVLGHRVQSVRSKDAHAGLPNSKAEMRNQAPTRPAHCPSGLFALGEKVGQLCSGLEWTFGTVEGADSIVPLTSPHQLLALPGSRSLSGASGGAARAHGSGGSGCLAERPPGSKVPS